MAMSKNYTGPRMEAKCHSAVIRVASSYKGGQPLDPVATVGTGLLYVYTVLLASICCQWCGCLGLEGIEGLVGVILNQLRRFMPGSPLEKGFLFSVHPA